MTGLSAIARADSLVRVLEVQGELAVPELANALELPASTTYRLLRQLLEAGWVEPGERRGAYRLGPWFLKVAARMEFQLDVRRVARPWMVDLVGSSGAAVTLWVEREGRAVCVEREVPVLSNTLPPEVGDSVPLLRGAGPLALLAFGPDRVLARSGERADARVPAVRRAGVAIECDPVHGTTGFAAPVRNHRGELVAALTLTTVGEGYEPAAWVRAAADAIGGCLGFLEVG